MNKLYLQKVTKNWYVFAKMADTGSWSITSKCDIEHIVYFGFLVEDREMGKIRSLILGPLTIGIGRLK